MTTVKRTSPQDLRLRARADAGKFHVVLVEPEIPPNTGNIARLCAATACPLHLVGKLGFKIDDHAVRRAGLDYWHLVDVKTHVDFAHFKHALTKDERPPRMHLFTAHAKKSYLDSDFQPGDVLVFGKESVGLSEELVSQHPDSLVGIPTIGAVRSLNLSNAVSIALFEALRRVGALANTEMA